MYYCYFKSHKMLKILPIAFLLAIVFSFNSLKAQEELMLYEGFDDGTLPAGWSQQYVSGAVDWTFPSAGVGTPSTVHGGTNKARFYYASSDGYSTKLITSAISFGDYTNNPTLNFWHTQKVWFGDQDYLRIYYRLSDVDPWILIEEYLGDIPDWTEANIALPEVSNTFYLAFEGVANYGYGVQLDDIVVYASLPPSYCATLSECTLNWIANVAFGTINNPSLCDGGYSDYTLISTDVTLGATIPITVTPNALNTSLICGVWFDWNQNYDFTDADEYFQLTYEGGVFTGNVLVPATATLGNTRMRVRMQDGDINPILQPCGPEVLATQGEVEDYTVNVVPNEMEYVSSTTTAFTEVVEQGDGNQHIIGIEIVTENPLNPLVLANLVFSTTGTTVVTDILNAKVFYTGVNNIFATDVQYGETFNNPTGEFNIAGNIPLAEGTNYFWLTYDIAPDATPGNVVNASCLFVQVGAEDYVPDITAPGPGRVIQEAGPDPTIVFEDFTSESFPPAGWTAVIGSGTKNWDRVTSGTSPTCSPHSLPAMARYNAYGATSGSYATLFSPTLDFSNRGNEDCPVTFWMYRDNGYSAYLEGVDVLVNTTATLDGATQIGRIYRSRSLEPIETADGWYEYTFNIPIAFNGNAVVMFKAFSAYGNNFFIDDISIATFPSPMEYVSSTTTQITGPLSRGVVNQGIIGIEVVTNGVLEPLSITNFNFTTNGTSNLTDIQNAKVWYTGTSNIFATTTQFGEPFAVPTATFDISGNQVLATGTNYFWLTFDIPAIATNGNWVDAGCLQVTVAGENYVPTETEPGGARQIQSPIAGEYTIGTGGDYPTLAAIFNDINILGLSGNTQLNIIENQTLAVPFVINPWTEAGAGGYFLTIKAGVPNVVLEGTATTDAVLVLNGADRVIIDGEFNVGERNLTIRNNATSGTNAAIWLKSAGTGLGCSDVTIKNTNVFGAATATTVTTTLGIYAAGATVSTSGTGADNDNLTIHNNHIKRAYYGIFVRGLSSTVLNDNLQIVGNIIGSEDPTEYVLYRGIDVTNAAAPLISQNYVNNMRRTDGSNIAAIDIGQNSAGAVITQNRIHGIVQASSGGWGAYGINISSGTGNTNFLIANNAITEISTMNYNASSTTYNPFGIRITGGTGHKLYYNSVNLYGVQGTAGGNPSLSSALLITSASVNSLDIRNNVFSNSLEGLAGSNSYAICVIGSATSFANIDNNDYYGSGPYGVLGHLGTSYNATSNSKTTLAAWQAATTKDLASKAEDPLYTANDNLLPSSFASPLVLSGIAIPGVTVDILGNQRGVIPTIGAYEVEVIGLLPPVLVAPLKNSIAVPNQPEFIWQPVNDAESYQIQIATDVDFVNLILDQTGILVTSFIPAEPLTETTLLYWRARGESTEEEGNWSQTWNFITQGTLTTPVQVSPGNELANMPIDINFIWEPVFGANQYTLQVSQLADFSEIEYEFTGLTNTNQLINGLMMAMPYYWRVNATNGVNVSEWSDTWTFSTGAFTTLGTGTSYNTSTGYPAPFGQFYNGAFHQMLYTASELAEVGLSAGPIYGLGFNVANVNTCGPLLNYTLKIKHTTVNNLSAFDLEGWTTVFTAASYQPFNGWNLHSFDAPFIWDGVSNILIDVCFNNYPNGYTNNASTYYTVTSFTSVVYDRSDSNPDLCIAPASTNTSTYRANIRFINDPGVVLLNPENGEIAVQVPVTFEVSNNGYELYYDYQISTSLENFETEIVYEETTIESMFELNLDFSTTYYWRARALTGLGLTEWSAVGEFETEKVFYVGDGANFNTSTTYPAPYGNKYMGAKHQILFKAADFAAAGFIPGEIRGLAFDVAQVNNCGVLNNFYIKMKAVTQNALTTFDNTGTGWIDVIAPSDYTPYEGWNMHRFDIPFVWDGISNVLIQTCFYTPEVTFNASTKYTQTNYNSVAVKYQNGNANICEATSPNTVSMYRPNIAFIGFESLQAPVLVAPTDLSVNVPLYPTFSWQPAGPADLVQYDLMVADNPEFTDPVLFVDDIQQTSHQMSFALNNNTIYYWKVITESLDEEYISEWSEIWSFTTQIASPVLAQPENNAVGIPTIPLLSWLETNGAAYYNIQVSLTNDFTTTIVNQDGIVELEYLLPELSLNTKYYWRVRATDMWGNLTDWSETWNFTTVLIPPTLATPMDGSIGIPVNADFSWNTSINANQYQIQVSSDEFQTTVFDLSTALTSANVQLENNTWYMWRVRSRNTGNGNISEWSTPWTFLTQLDEPTLVTPENGAIGVSYPNADLIWDLVPSGTRYNLVLATDANFNNILVDDSYVYGNQYNVGVLEPYTEYFWKVMAFDDDNINFSGWSEVFSFSTVVGPVVLVSPENNSIRQLTNPELVWEAIDGVTYQLQVSPYSHFGYTIVNESGLTTNNYFVENILLNNQNYYWKVRAMQGEFIGDWSDVFTFRTLAKDETPWEVTETGNSSTVIIPTGVVSLIAGRSIATGDAIGLFYDDNGVLNCAGYGIWDGYELPITVYGDDLATPNKDGYTVGEPYYFKVWDNTAKDYYYAEATFASGPDNYQIAAVSLVANLNVINTTTQTITLANGWNLISSYVNPAAPNMVDVFAPIVTDVKIVKNGQGQQYIPQWNINTINNWNIRHGYFVYMLSSQQLELTGAKIQPSSTSIYLQQGWRLTSYIRDNPIAPQTGFATINDNLVIAKNGTGGIYVPQFNINTIGNLVPGSGYNLYLSATEELIYPSNVIQSRAGINDITPSPKYLVPSVNNTGSDATLILELSTSFNGQEIGVWNSRAELVGSAVIENGSAAINIWGNNNISEQNDGAYEGEFLTVKSYNPENNQYSDIHLNQINELVSGNHPEFVTFAQNAIYFAKADIANEAATGEMSIKNLPNPCATNTTIEFSLPNEGFIEISLYSLNGQKVAHITDANFKAGTHTLNFDASNLTSGTYNLILRSGSQQVNQIMLIVK